MASKQSINPSDFDASVRPGDDFFHYVNNKWIAANPIPPEESKWGSFYILRAQADENLGKILEELNGESADSLDETGRKVQQFYKTAMDVSVLNAQKDKPLAPLFGKVDAITTLEELSAVLGHLHRSGVSAFWGIGSEPDAKQSDVTALYLAQSGLGLPDRDYYLNEDEKSKEIRTKYASYIEGMMSEVREPVMALETAMAQASMTRVELRDVEKQYNKMTFADLQVLTPNISWKRYLTEAGVETPEYAIVCQPEFFKAVDRLFAGTPLADIKRYLRWHILNGLASYLSEDFEKKTFDFYSQTFSGVKDMKPRWRRVLHLMNALLDEPLAKLYVERHFTEAAKAKINALVDHLMKAYAVRIDKLDWMGPATKEKALVKLSAIRRKLGYPDKWKDMTALEVGADSYAENYMRAHRFEFDRQIKKIGKPVDLTEWYMAPQTVNACYHPLYNEILFPAAILQPPFFDPEADDAVNYGGIGTVIGHELTHGFDDQGALFDPKGNLANWWTEEDKKLFEEKTKHLGDQFNEYEPSPGLHVNGQLTMGENIADLGGMYIALDGLRLRLAENGSVGPIDGLTPEQRFFLSYTITERSHMREEALRSQVQLDPHSPSEYRVNGPLSNMPEFYEAFGVKKGDKLWREPEDRVAIW